MTDNNITAEAVQLHRSGNLPAAEQKYMEALGQNPEDISVMHNLGMVMLGLGKLKQGVELVKKALATEVSFPEKGATYREVGTTLFQASYWEEAKPWLKTALEYYPDDKELLGAFERCLPRGYLQPEIYDPLACEVLKRYSPRESSHYIYVIDIMGTCNLSCPSCPVGNFGESLRKKGMMDPALFSEIVSKIAKEHQDQTVEIFLFNWGEPLIHPNLPEFIRILHKHQLSCQLSTNLNVNKDFEDVIQANPSMLKVSISGFSEETYSYYHRGGNIHLLKSNLYRLKFYLDKTKATTRIWIGHHLYKNTIQDRGEIQKLCDELGFDYQPIQAFYQPLEKLKSLVLGEDKFRSEPILEDLLLHPIKSLHHIKQHRSGHYDCELRFNQTVINFDGSVALCCGVYEQQNMLNVNFLDASTEVINTLKYSHPFCLECRTNGLDYSVSELPTEMYNKNNK